MSADSVSKARAPAIDEHVTDHYAPGGTHALMTFRYTVLILFVGQLPTKNQLQLGKCQIQSQQ